MVDRQLIKRVLGQRTLAQSLIARYQLGVSGDMPGHPAFVAPLAVVAPPAAAPAPVFEQTPLDDAALASFFSTPDAEREPMHELLSQPAPVTPVQTDERAEIGALPAGAPNPLDQQGVRPADQPRPQTGREVVEQSVPLPGTRAEQAHPQTSQVAAMPQARQSAPAVPEIGVAQGAGTSVPANVTNPASPQERSQPAPAPSATGDPYVDMVNKVRAARMPKGPAQRPRVPLGQRLNEARDFDSPVDLSQAVSHDLPDQPAPPVPAQPAPAAERSTQPSEAEQASHPAAAPAPYTLPQAVEEAQPALPLPRPEAGTNVAMPTDEARPAVQADRATIEQHAEPALGATEASTPEAPGDAEAHLRTPLPAVPSQPDAGDVRPAQRQVQGEHMLAEQSPVPAETAAPLPNQPPGSSTAQAGTPALPPAVPPAAGEDRQPAPQAKLAVAPETGFLAGQPHASRPQEQPSERVPAEPPMSQPVPDLAGAARPIEAQPGQDTAGQGATMPDQLSGVPRAEAVRIEHLDQIDPSQVGTSVELAQPGLEQQPGQPVSRADTAVNDRPGMPTAPPAAPGAHLQRHEQPDARSEPGAVPSEPRASVPPATPEQSAAIAASDQTIVPEQTPVRAPSSDSVTTPARRPEPPRQAAVQPPAARTPGPVEPIAEGQQAQLEASAPVEPIAERQQAQAEASAPPPAPEAPGPVEPIAEGQQAQAEASAPPPAGTPGPVEPIAEGQQAQAEASAPPPAAGTPGPVEPIAEGQQAQAEASAPAAAGTPGPIEPIAEGQQAQAEASAPPPAPEAPGPVEPIAEGQQAQAEASAPPPAAGTPGPVEPIAEGQQAQAEASAPPPAGTPAGWAARLRRQQAPAPETPVSIESIAEGQQAQLEASASVEPIADGQQAQAEASAPPPAGTPSAWAARLRRHDAMQQPQSTDRMAVQPGVQPPVGAPIPGVPTIQASPLQQNEHGTSVSVPDSMTPSGPANQQAGQPQPPLRPHTLTAQAPLRESTRRFLKPIIGRDPADVRVYRGAAANQLAAHYAADALTDGASVVLAADESETTPRALGLLAHELAHVEQASRFVAPQTMAERDAHERAARRVEAQAVQQARAEREQLLQASPASSPLAARPGAGTPPARPQASQPTPDEQWNGLPAPWEPLPADVFAPQQPAFAPETGVTPAAQRSSSPAAPTPADTQAARPGAARRGVSAEPMRADHSRIQPSESAVEPAPQDAPSAPEPDLDLLARQVYQVIKQRLAAERRRGRS